MAAYFIWHLTKPVDAERTVEDKVEKKAHVTLLCFSSPLNIPLEASSRIEALPPDARAIYSLWSRYKRVMSWAEIIAMSHPDEPRPEDDEDNKRRFEEKIASLKGKARDGAAAFLSLILVETSDGEAFALAQRMGVAFHDPIEKAPKFPFVAPTGMSRLKTGEWRNDSRTHDTNLCRTLLLMKPSELIEKQQKLLQAVSETTSIPIENISLKIVSGL